MRQETWKWQGKGFKMNREEKIHKLIADGKFLEAQFEIENNTLFDSGWYFNCGKYMRTLQFIEEPVAIEVDRLLNTCPGHINKYWSNIGLLYKLHGEEY